jgi:hypothetical protein
MKRSYISGLILIGVASVHASPAKAAGWGKQVVLAVDAYQGNIALDAAGNMTSLWYQNALPDGTPVNSIWASTASFGAAWSTPVNVSGAIGVASGSPVLLDTAAGKTTAVYNNSSNVGLFADHPLGGSWTQPATTNGVNQLVAGNDNGDQSLVWGGGGPRGAANPILAVHRTAGGNWSAPATIASGTYVTINGTAVAPDGTLAIAWESYGSVCGSRVCKTSNWDLHVSTLAPGAMTWTDSGILLGPSTARHFGALAADALGDLGLATTSSGNIVSLVRHAGTWSSAVTVAPLTSIGFSNTTLYNRIFGCDTNGHATFVGWNSTLSCIMAVDGNLVTNTWGSVACVSGADPLMYYFDFGMSKGGPEIMFWSTDDINTGNAIWSAIVRPSASAPWPAPLDVGTTFEGGGQPDSVAVNAQGEAAVLFHGQTSDFLKQVFYTNTYHP